MWQLQTTAQFASNLTANISLMLPIQALSDLVSKHPIFFLIEFEQVLYEMFF